MITKQFNDLATRALILVVGLLYPYLSFGQEFELKGQFKGEEPDNLVMSYYDPSNEVVIDTLQIVNGEFFTEGLIYGSQRIFITGDLESEFIDDPNRGYFFLEPGKIEISLEEDRFQEMRTEGSQTEMEYQNLQKEIGPIRKEAEELHQQFVLLQEKPAERDKLLELRNLLKRKNQEIKYIHLNFAFNNPGSNLSSYYGDLHNRNMSIDSLKMLYNSFSGSAATNRYAQKIEDFLSIRPANTGDRAPFFSSEDFKGQDIDLDDFKGKYLLLDFWAGWCKPCIEKHPELKELFKKYNSEGLEILGVSFDKNEEEWRENVMSQNLDLWPQVFVGLDNIKKPGSINRQYNVQPIPAYILIDDKGVIVGRYLSASYEDDDFYDLRRRLQIIF